MVDKSNEPKFVEDEAERPFTGTMAWTPDGRGIEVCVDAQRMYIPYSTQVEDEHGHRMRLVDKIIRQRLARTGVEFRKWRCEFCGGWHVERK
jgi:hypothetical protein